MNATLAPRSRPPSSAPPAHPRELVGSLRSGLPDAPAPLGHSLARFEIGPPSEPGRGRSNESPSAGEPLATRVPPATGEPLATADRARFSARLGAAIPDVRIHRDRASWQLADALGVPAFTIGRDIVLGRTVDERSKAGDRVLAHELAHAVQQGQATIEAGSSISRTGLDDAVERDARRAVAGSARPRTGAPIAIAAADPVAELLKPARRFKDLWREFEQAAYGLDVDKATDIAKQLVDAPYDFPDLLEHGIEAVGWLERHGEPAAAAALLGEVRSVWMIEFVSRDSKLPSIETLSWNASDPEHLIKLGDEAARAGRHEAAFELLGVANELLSYYALSLSEKRRIHLELESTDESAAAGSAPDPARERELRAATVLPRMIARSFAYSTMGQIYDQMRSIYAVYPTLEREAIGAGDTQAASAARAKSAELNAEIKRKYTWGSAQPPGSPSQEILQPVEIAEVSLTDTPRGPGLTLHGRNNAETDLTQLPGLPAPKEIGDNLQVQTLGNLQEALMAQTDFQAEIGRVKEIRDFFRDRPIDLNDQETRQQVWLLMYRSFAAAGPSPLRSLMSLIGRYLKAFTVHTTYNVRDWGVSYLDSTMPTDLADRAERDCGVYALTVAWDVYRTAKRADAKLDLSFDLVTMLEHVTLIITDRTASEFFMVNNDAITGPHTGSPDKELSKAYGGVRQMPYAVGPSVPVSIGTTKDPQKKFHDQAWIRYQAATDWGLAPRVPPEVEKLRATNPAEFAKQMAQLQKARYDQFYQDQAAFSELMTRLDAILDGLGPAASDATKLGPGLDARIDGALLTLRGFIDLGPGAGIIAGSAKSQAILPAQSHYLYTRPEGRTVHPLARFAKAILRLHRLGRAPTTKEAAFLKDIQRIDDFRDVANQYQQAGATGPF